MKIKTSISNAMHAAGRLLAKPTRDFHNRLADRSVPTEYKAYDKRFWPFVVQNALLIQATVYGTNVLDAHLPSHQTVNTAIVRTAMEVGCDLSMSNILPIRNQNGATVPPAELAGGACRDTALAGLMRRAGLATPKM